MTKTKRRTSVPRVSAEEAQVLLDRGTVNPPRGYCVRCWRRGEITPTFSAKRLRRCTEHHDEIERDRKANAEAAALRAGQEAELDEAIFTALKWLARQTGAGYDSSPDELNEVVFGAFWEAMPEKRRDITQARLDVASEAALAAFAKYTGEVVSPIACPECGDEDSRSRSGNNFSCRKCGWAAPEGAFGAIHIASQAQNQPYQNIPH